MSTVISTSQQILLLRSTTAPSSYPFLVTKVFERLLCLNQHVCKSLTKTDVYILIIPRRDLGDLLNDPVFYFSQVKLICVYYENNESYEQDQILLKALYPRLRLCHERDIPRELDQPIIDNAVDPSRPINREAINSFASSVTQRLSMKRPASTGRRPSMQGSSTALCGFIVKNMESIDARFKCPICQLVLREPYQLNCGDRICQACIKIENDEMSCSACAQVSSGSNIRRDKGFQRELEQLSISCAFCGFPEILKRYQEHIDRVHQEHMNTTEGHRTNHSIIDALLRSIRTPSSNDQHQNSLSEIEHKIKILYHVLNLLSNDEQRIHEELSSSQNSVQTISQEIVSLKSTAQHLIALANGLALNTDMIGEETLSLKQKLEDEIFPSDNGSYLWKISSVKEKMADAVSERTKSIYSPVFYSSPFGYNMCMRLYLNGDADVRGEYASLFVVLMRGEYDSILKWPYEYKIRIELIDQSTLDHNQRNISAEFWSDPTSPCFQLPIYHMNEGYGIKNFVLLKLLQGHPNLYIRDDVMFIRFQGDYLQQRPASLANTGTGATPNDEWHVQTTSDMS